jgi:hypothetical protein
VGFPVAAFAVLFWLLPASPKLLAASAAPAGGVLVGDRNPFGSAAADQYDEPSALSSGFAAAPSAPAALPLTTFSTAREKTAGELAVEAAHTEEATRSRSSSYTPGDLLHSVSFP